MTFETAIYTDVTKEEAVDGVDGFNFQAVSPGMDGNHQRQVRENMLHLISSRWPLEREELDHPATAAYFRHEGSSYFSRGRSTGTTNNGRRGNQLTQALVTTDDDDIEPYLPAQIFAACDWKLEKADSKSCAPWFAPLEIDERFEVDALWDMLQADSWVASILPAYLTMLEHASAQVGQKVVIVHDDLDTVMRWFTAGTMLLDRKQALQLEYRAFSTDVFQNSAQLIGVHPDLDSGSLAGAHVVNLIERTVSNIEVSESALQVTNWVQRLDTFEALEVISIARRWMPALGTKLGVAGAEMVTETHATSPGRSEWELGLQVIEGLARHGLVDDLKLYFDELTEAVGSYRLHGNDDFVLAANAARFAGGSGLEGLAEAVLLPSLESLAAEPEHAEAWALALDAEGTWEWPVIEEPQQITELVSEVALGAPVAALPALLGLVTRLGVPADAERLKPALRAVASELLSNPKLAGDGIDAWFGSREIAHSLRRQFVVGVTGSTTSSRYQEMLRSGMWDFLDPGAESGDSVDMAVFAQWLAAARIARLPAEERGVALQRAQVKPGAVTWEFALASTELPKDFDLYEVWFEVVGADRGLRDFIFDNLRKVLLVDARKAKAREVDSWVAFARSLEKALPNDGAVAQALSDLEQYRRAIPSLFDKAKEKGDGMKNLFSRKSQEEGED